MPRYAANIPASNVHGGLALAISSWFLAAAGGSVQVKCKPRRATEALSSPADAVTSVVTRALPSISHASAVVMAPPNGSTTNCPTSVRKRTSWRANLSGSPFLVLDQYRLTSATNLTIIRPFVGPVHKENQMSNLTSALKSEVFRIARKLLRSEVDPLRKTVSLHRSEIAALKKRLRQLEQPAARVRKTDSPSAVAIATKRATPWRFSGADLLAQRKRLGLSAAATGRLFQVSGQTIYNWEAGKSHPDAKYRDRFSALRKLNKSAATEIVQSIVGSGIEADR